MYTQDWHNINLITLIIPKNDQLIKFFDLITVLLILYYNAMSLPILMNVDEKRLEKDENYIESYKIWLEAYNGDDVDDSFDFHDEYMNDFDTVERMMYDLSKGRECHVGYCTRMDPNYNDDPVGKLREWYTDHPEYKIVFEEWDEELFKKRPGCEIHLKDNKGDGIIDVEFRVDEIYMSDRKICNHCTLTMDETEDLLNKLTEGDTFGIGGENWWNYC